MPSGKQRGGGRVTQSPKKKAAGRYTAPIPKKVRQSPPWYPYVLIGLLVVGLIVIIGNYAAFMPGGTHTYYLVIGIAAIVAGLVMATTYH